MNPTLSYETLKGASDMLFECWMQHDILAQAEKVSVAIFNLDLVLNRNPQINYYYRDSLSLDLAHLRKKELAYIDGFKGEVKYISFSDAKDLKIDLITSSGKSLNSVIPDIDNISPSAKETFEKLAFSRTNKVVRLGNAAIGQVYINDEECFCVKYAVETSLYSTIENWFHESLILVNYFKRNFLLKPQK